MPGEASSFPSVAAVAEEVVRDRPGQQLVLNGLLDLMLVAAPRSWFDGPDALARRFTALSVAFKRLRGTRPSAYRSPEPVWRAG